MYCFEKKDSVRLKENYLNMGQTSPSGENIYLNNLYLTKNGKPFCPVMGEAHISRLPAEEWKDRIEGCGHKYRILLSVLGKP